MELVSQDAAEFERRIEFRYRRWVTKAYLRALAATARNVENAAEVDPSDNPPEWATDLGTRTGRKKALEGWKRHWSTKERECTNTDLTEAAYNQKDGPFLNQWKNATTRLIDPDRSTRIQTIEAVLRQNRPPNWHPAAKKRPK